MHKQAAMESCRDILEKHFKGYNIDCVIPYIAPLIIDPNNLFGAENYPTIQSYKITYEDWYKFNKLNFYKQEFEDLLK